MRKYRFISICHPHLYNIYPNFNTERSNKGDKEEISDALNKRQSGGSHVTQRQLKEKEIEKEMEIETEQEHNK